VSTGGPKIGAMLTMLTIGVVAFAFGSHSYEIGLSAAVIGTVLVGFAAICVFLARLVREFRDREWEKVGRA
jgi:hypothetical protein